LASPPTTYPTLALDRGFYFDGFTKFIELDTKLHYTGAIDVFLRHTQFSKNRYIYNSSDGSVDFI
jgi:hypothetical protein